MYKFTLLQMQFFALHTEFSHIWILENTFFLLLGTYLYTFVLSVTFYYSSITMLYSLTLCRSPETGLSRPCKNCLTRDIKTRKNLNDFFNSSAQPTIRHKILTLLSSFMIVKIIKVFHIFVKIRYLMSSCYFTQKSGFLLLLLFWINHPRLFRIWGARSLQY